MEKNIEFLNKIGFTDTSKIFNKRLNKNKNINPKYIINFFEFNIYQILTYLIFYYINNNNKYLKKKIKKKKIFNYCNNNNLNLCIINNCIKKININSNNEFKLLNNNNVVNKTTRNLIISKNNNSLFSINNLDKSKKYLLFLKCNGNVKKSNCSYLNILDYLFFYAENTDKIEFTLNINSPILISDSYLCEFTVIPENVYRIYSYIFGCKFKIPNNEYDLTKCIAVWNRSELLSNILIKENECKTNYTYNTILGYSQDKDINTIINKTKNLKNIYYFYTPNSTLGLKWQHIIEFTKIFKINNILIQGSDDLIIMNNLNKELIYKYDFIGQNSWYIEDENNRKKYLCQYKSTKIFGKYIGTGRIINNKVLKNNNYNIFNCILFKLLDAQLNYLSQNINNKIISEPICNSIKNEEINCLNPLSKLLESKNIDYTLIEYS